MGLFPRGGAIPTQCPPVLERRGGPPGMGEGASSVLGPPSPHTAADTPESLRSYLGRLGDRDALWENEETRL